LMSGRASPSRARAKPRAMQCASDSGHVMAGMAGSPPDWDYFDNASGKRLQWFAGGGRSGPRDIRGEFLPSVGLAQRSATFIMGLEGEICQVVRLPAAVTPLEEQGQVDRIR